jgi:hypothetical protein
MKGSICMKGLAGIIFLINFPHWAFGVTGKPEQNIIYDKALFNPIQSDSFPPKNNASPKSDDKINVEQIKVVPKARNLPAPIPISVKVKPVIIIKPKIIKPIVKGIH